MSALRSYEVRLFIGRTLVRRITAESADAAEIIARYLFEALGGEMFQHEADDIFDVQVDDEQPEAGR